MYPFSLEKATENNVYTLNGDKVVLLKTDLDNTYPIVGYIKTASGEYLSKWRLDGTHSKTDLYTLVLKEERYNLILTFKHWNNCLNCKAETKHTYFGISNDDAETLIVLHKDKEHVNDISDFNYSKTLA